MDKLNEQFQRIEAKLRELNTKQTTNAELMEDVGPALARIEDGLVALLVLLEKVLDRFALLQNLGVSSTHINNTVGDTRTGGNDIKDSTVSAGKDIVGGGETKTIEVTGKEVPK